MKKRLAEYLKELAVITISITIAFWVENYREYRKASADTDALLATIRSQAISHEAYLENISKFADLHSRRFDSLVTDLSDQKIENVQLLADICVAYLPYISDVGELSGVVLFKWWGGLAPIQHDSVIHALYFHSVMTTNLLNSYNESWKSQQERLKNLVVTLYGSRLRYDFEKSKMVVMGDEPLVVDKVMAEKLRFELVSWITLMKQNQIFIKNLSFNIHEIRRHFWREVIPADTVLASRR